MFKVDFDQCLLEILRQHPQGISEFNLQAYLRQPPHVYLPENPSADSLILFRTHFWLFHRLYQLQNRGREKQIFDLHISPLNIRLLEYSASTRSALCEADPLREYYLDLSQLFGTTQTSVNNMLDDAFHKIYAAPEKAQALACLNLCEPVTLSAIKQRYRQLAQRHHPDKGGDPARFMQLQHAMHTLKQYYHSPQN
ncbi:MAG: DnaJ domain-containing protein [Oceanospirillaceae bacterium]|nr:DnaJ domain-containing protein [Oceanospirillaceae bacterium]MCP5335317.1 DnaJ domain-containing protein [Oceanospirillaceae bacterium]MCP5350730.1 DnaJ domain-containing protein [Oceanospirillaceae bacterium]